jgi:hypothetical protein
MSEFLARAGDRINPIVVKEARQAVNSRLVAAFLLLFPGIQLLVVLLMITVREVSGPDALNFRAGRDLFTFVQGILLGTCLILIPTMAGVRLAAERSDVNVDLLFISSLTPRAVLSGKLFAAAALALLIFSACAPFMTFAYVMRGLDVPTILLVLTADYLAVLLATALALFLASVPANRGLRILLGLGGFLSMAYLGAGLLAGTSAFLQLGSGFDTGSWDFWAACASVAALTFGAIGLLFVWSVALISPPTANRAFAVRLYTLVLWLATGFGFGVWSWHLGRSWPALAWGLVGCALFSLQIAIAVCERDEWGARVARRIPRKPLLRIPAFLAYSGAAGGLAFGVIGAVLSASALALAPLLDPAPLRRAVVYEPLTVGALGAGYVYCYCLSAAVLRRLLAKSGLPAAYTWAVALVLFGLGCTLPFVARFALFDRTSRYGYPDEIIGLYLTNPVVMIDDALRRSESHAALTAFFLLAWGAVATVLNAPWLLKQVANFRPPKGPRAGRPPRAVPVERESEE